MLNRRLTKRQTELLDLLLSHLDPAAVPMGRREIAKRFGCSSSTLQQALVSLRRRGLIQWKAGGAQRGIKINLPVIGGRFGFMAEVADIIRMGQWDRSPVARKIAEALRLYLQQEKENVA